jgi:ribosomal protein S6E (S10)
MEQNLTFLFKVYKNENGERRDSEVRGQEIKIEGTRLNTET